MRKMYGIVAMVSLGAFMSSAIVTASAAAAACTSKAGSKNYQLCINGSAITETAGIAVESTKGGAMSLNLENVYPTTAIECKTTGLRSGNIDVSSGVPVSFHLFPTVGECAITGHLATKCETEKSKEFREIIGKLSSLEKGIMTPFGSEVLNVYFGNKGSETCPSAYKGTLLILGEYECTLHEAAVEAVQHEMTCASSASHETYAKWSSSPATPLSYTQTIALGSTRKGEKFSIYEA